MSKIRQDWAHEREAILMDAFQSLVPDTRDFLAELKHNNNRDWFLEHKSRYESTMKRPAEILLEQIGADLEKSLGASAKPKLFRPYRDVRFSKDKTPYHQHLHMGWTVDLGGVQPIGFFFGISLDYISVGAGIMAFDKPGLVSWRGAIDGGMGAGFASEIAKLTNAGYRLPEAELKRVPAPFDKEHPHGGLLKRKSLALWRDFEEMNQPLATLPAVFSELEPMVQLLANLD